MKHERDAYEDTQPQVHSQVCSLFSLHHVEPPRNLHHVAEDVRAKVLREDVRKFSDAGSKVRLKG